MKREKMNKNYLDRFASQLLAQTPANEYIALDLYAEDSQFIRFNNAKVRQLGTVEDASIRIRYYLQDKAGGIRTNSAGFSLTGNSAEDSALAKTKLEMLRKEAGSLPVDPYAEIPAQAKTSSLESPGKLLEKETAAEKILKEAAGADFTGIYSAGDIMRAMVDSRGANHWFRTGNYIVDYSIYGKDERAYKGCFSGNTWKDESYVQELKEARAKLAALENPIREVPRGNYRTYLAPGAVSALIGTIADMPSEMAIRQGDSAFRLLREGKKTLSPLFSLHDDFRTGSCPRFNEQGELAPEYFAVVEKGKLQHTFIGARTAKEFGLTANGATRAESFRAPVMAPGNLKIADAAKAVGEGLYISDLHYLNWSDQQGGRITGMTRFACFWVENGKLVAPIKNLRWDDEVFRLFGSELEAVTAETQIFPDTASYEFRSVGAIQVPGMLLKSMQFTL